MEIKLVKIDTLIRPDYNPRKDLTEADFEYQALRKNIERFGLVVPLIVNKRNNNVIGGNQRVNVLKDLGYEEVHVTLVDLDEAQEKALNIILNKVEGSWDEKTLRNVLNDMKACGFDVNSIGFTDSELKKLFPPAKDIDEFFGVGMDDEEAEHADEEPEETEVRVMLGRFSFTVDRKELGTVMAQIRYSNGFVKEAVEAEIINRLKNPIPTENGSQDS